MCPKDIELLSRWKPRMLPEYDNILTQNGMGYMKKLGARMRQRLSDLKYFKKPNLSVSVLSTNITRTIQSAREFLKGFFCKNDPKTQVQPLDTNEDYLLKFPDLCEKYLKVFFN